MLTSDSAHARQSPPLFWPLLGYLSGKVSIVMASKIKCQSYESGFLLHDLGEVTQPFPASVASPFVMIHTCHLFGGAHFIASGQELLTW